MGKIVVAAVVAVVLIGTLFAVFILGPLIAPNVPPIAAFSFGPPSPFSGDLITFNASASSDRDGRIVSYAWQFGDGTTGANLTATHAYAKPGSYKVNLTVTDDDVATNTTSQTVTVRNRAPVAVLTVTPTSALTFTAITADGTGSSDADGTIASYSIDWGDGSPASVGPVAMHEYTDDRVYTITLTVTDDLGASATKTATVTIQNRPPTASFAFSPESPTVGDPVTLDASASSDPDGTIALYAWDFGDGQTGTGKVTTHAYSLDGTYTIRLTVTDDDGLTTDSTASIVVQRNVPPVANFTFSPDRPKTDEIVTVDASPSFDRDGTIVSYAWDFGDGTTGSGKVATHAYAQHGTYPVSLTVTDDDGSMGTMPQDVRIFAPPVGNFTFSTSSPAAGQRVTFNATNSSDPDGTIVGYAWDFTSDGIFDATGLTTTYAYDRDGTFDVTLRVTDDEGFTAMATKSIVVQPNVLPVANFTFSPDPATAGMPVTFNATNSSDPDGTIVEYEWDFGDGTSAVGAAVNHTYPAPGTYTVTLTVTDNKSAQNRTTRTVTVITPVGFGVDWTYYDFFKVPFGEWWDMRGFYALLGDKPIGAECFSAAGIAEVWCTGATVATFPYTNWQKTPVGDAAIYAPYRFTADVRMHPAYTIDRPVLLPLCADVQAALASLSPPLSYTCPTPPAGGNVSIDTSITYLTSPRARELKDPLGRACPDLEFSNDGFYTELRTTVTMDAAAAAKLFGVTDPAQWTPSTAHETALISPGCGTGLRLDSESGLLEKGLKAWFEAQGNGPYNIRSAFGTVFQEFIVEATGSFDAATGKHTLTFMLVGWGHEVLHARWFYWGATSYRDVVTGASTAAPAGWWGMEAPWFEDLRMLATIDTDFDATITGVQQYHFRHSADVGSDMTWYTADDVPKWVWEPVLADRIPAIPGVISELKDYAGLTYIHTTVGSRRYGTAYAYDYVPAVWPLKLGETQTFRFPAETVVLYNPLSPKSDVPAALVPIATTIVFSYSVPAGVGTYDAATRTLTVVGPISVGTYPTTATGKPLESRPSYNLVKG